VCMFRKKAWKNGALYTTHTLKRVGVILLGGLLRMTIITKETHYNMPERVEVARIDSYVALGVQILYS